MAKIPKRYANPQIQANRPRNYRWWLSSNDDIGKDLVSVVQGIEQRQSYRQTRNIHYARLYCNLPLQGLSGWNFYKDPPAASRSRFNRVRFNLVKSSIDTAQALIARNKPRPLFLTEDGNWSLQQKAKKLTQFIDGEFDDQGLYREGPKCFKDACTFGTGGFKFVERDGRVYAERFLADEIIVDDIEAIYGDPRCIYHRTFRHREVLEELISKWEKDPAAREVKLAAIKAAKSGNEKDTAQTDSEDMIYVVEGWHLPSGKGAGDGKHCIAINNTTLFEREYNKDYFPFSFYRWSDPLVGFFGTGVAEELQGIQLEINKILADISEAHHLFVTPTILLEEHSPRLEINNEIGRIVRYRGQKPEFFTPSGYPAEIYNHLVRLRQWGFEQIGLSPLSATSQKPAGLDSGKAIREYNDIQTVRFAIAGQAYEQFFIDSAYIFVDMTADIYKGKPDKEVDIKGSKFLQTVPWSDLYISENRFVMRAFPTALLPKEPSARLERLQELQDAGWIDREYAMSLGEFPDIDQYTNLQTSDLENTRRMLDLMIEKQEYTPPEQFMNLKLALKLAQQTYVKSKLDNAPPGGLEQVLRFMTQVQDMLAQQAIAAQAEAAAMPQQQVQAPAQAPAPPQAPVSAINGTGNPIQ